MVSDIVMRFVLSLVLDLEEMVQVCFHGFHVVLVSSISLLFAGLSSGCHSLG